MYAVVHHKYHSMKRDEDYLLVCHLKRIELNQSRLFLYLCFIFSKICELKTCNDKGFREFCIKLQYCSFSFE